MLVTGYPGLRARAFVREVLAAEPETRLIALVHPARRAEAEARLDQEPERSRVRLVAGDPTAIDFGLDASSYAELAATVTVVQHFYQVLDRAVTAETANAITVGGAREIVEFARAAKALERLIHHSSVFVSGERTGLVREGELQMGQRFRSPVEEALAIAEKMLGNAAPVPVTVVRAADVVGDSRTGEVDRLYGVYAPLVFLARTPAGARVPLPPRSEVPVQVIPADYLARAARVLARQPDAAGKTVQLVDPQALSARRLLELCAARFGLELEPGINAIFGKALFGNPGVSLMMKNLRTLGDLLAPGVVYDDTNARALLSGSGVTCPSLESYLGVLIDALQRKLGTGAFSGHSSEAWDVVD